MPTGKHTSVRVALAVPPKLHEQLSEWADSEGRPLASLCMYLIEQSLRQAQREGIAPSIGSRSKDEIEEPMRHSRTMNDKEFEEYYQEQYGDLTQSEEPSAEDIQRMAAIRASQGIGKKVEGSKKEALLGKLVELLSD